MTWILSYEVAAYFEFENNSVWTMQEYFYRVLRSDRSLLKFHFFVNVNVQVTFLTYFTDFFEDIVDNILYILRKSLVSYHTMINMIFVSSYRVKAHIFDVGEVSTIFEYFLSGFVQRLVLNFSLIVLDAEFNSLSNGVSSDILCWEKKFPSGTEIPWSVVKMFFWSSILEPEAVIGQFFLRWPALP
jgi:hypothetical protein